MKKSRYWDTDQKKWINDKQEAAQTDSVIKMDYICKDDHDADVYLYDIIFDRSDGEIGFVGLDYNGIEVIIFPYDPDGLQIYLPIDLFGDWKYRDKSNWPSEIYVVGNIFDNAHECKREIKEAKKFIELPC